MDTTMDRPFGFNWPTTRLREQKLSSTTRGYPNDTLANSTQSHRQAIEVVRRRIHPFVTDGIVDIDVLGTVDNEIWLADSARLPDDIIIFGSFLNELTLEAGVVEVGTLEPLILAEDFLD